MNGKQHLSLLLGISVIVITFYFFPDEAIARAGGGSSKGGGILGLILWPFILIYSGIVTYIAAKKNRQAKNLLKQISEKDPMWQIDHIKARIEVAYFKIQEAWRERNQDIAKEYMSNRLYTKHKLQTDDMLRRGIKNIMESINLEEATIVEILDYRDDSKDSFWVLIKGSMVDYTIVENTGDVIDGEKKNLSFKELWRFKREDHGRVLDEIDQDVSISDLRGFNPFSEEIT
ncbi:MAG: Tim44-like domain-containing protein [Candidatus Thiodiazotropha endolucinida]